MFYEQLVLDQCDPLNDCPKHDQEIAIFLDEFITVVDELVFMNLARVLSLVGVGRKTGSTEGFFRGKSSRCGGPCPRV